MEHQDYCNYFFNKIGEDPNREGLKNTSKRVEDSWGFLYSGYGKNPKEALGSIFEQGACDEMVLIKNIEFYSMCEHHILPFFGHISIGYIPDKKVVGISGLVHLVEIYSRRLQIQERLTAQIAETIMEVLNPKGAMVVCEAKHLCMSMRGVQKQDVSINTSAIRGLFKSDPKTRAEFMQLLKS
ncbi:GTP cyclohydrolase I FolE [Helicobacter sp. 12S02634-8]|uniref:GTP cyclohydrolase I FolE n=1 Tax=Helicobacter sp. 12S02634-8 TaxID=1476199 RepID=UPI000BA65F61|nr:GTP cyclohydrolase I FolE [Helicobacter sp. 12S02634-8]PAF48448.1 GTP cyclohydrolase I FolE [Helicobacter sp. 12S02634-8]